jgi:hypothetical protein
VRNIPALPRPAAKTPHPRRGTPPGPSPGWFVREKVEGRIPVHFNTTLQTATVENNQLQLAFAGGTFTVDHIIAGTGFHPAASRLKFADPSLLSAIKTVDDVPILSRSFESSVFNLYFIELALAFDFDPLTRFTCGAGFHRQTPP